MQDKTKFKAIMFGVAVLLIVAAAIIAIVLTFPDLPDSGDNQKLVPNHLVSLSSETRIIFRVSFTYIPLTLFLLLL